MIIPPLDIDIGQIPIARGLPKRKQINKSFNKKHATYEYLKFL